MQTQWARRSARSKRKRCGALRFSLRRPRSNGDVGRMPISPAACRRPQRPRQHPGHPEASTMRDSEGAQSAKFPTGSRSVVVLIHPAGPKRRAARAPSPHMGFPPPWHPGDRISRTRPSEEPRKARHRVGKITLAPHARQGCGPSGALRMGQASPQRGIPENGAPGGIRTPDQRLRKPLLYPAELQARAAYSPRFGRAARAFRAATPDPRPDR